MAVHDPAHFRHGEQDTDVTLADNISIASISAIHLYSTTAEELRSKLSDLLLKFVAQKKVHVSHTYVKGPAGIPVSVSDDVVRNIPHETTFIVK